MAKKKTKKPKFLHEQNPEELAQALEELIEEEDFDTIVRDTLHGVADRLRQLSETHVPDILRDLRDMGWCVVLHHDKLDRYEQVSESIRTKWILQKRVPVDDRLMTEATGVIAEGSGYSDEDALWNAARLVARYELPSKTALNYASKLVKSGKSFKTAIEAAQKKYSKRKKGKK